MVGLLVDPAAAYEVAEALTASFPDRLRERVGGDVVRAVEAVEHAYVAGREELPGASSR